MAVKNGDFMTDPRKELNRLMCRNQTKYKTYNAALYHQSWYYSLPINCIFHIPELQSELEYQLIKRFNWDRFVFQFPPYIDLISHNIMAYNIKTGGMIKIEQSIPRLGRPSLYPKDMPKAKIRGVQQKWKDYRAILDLPEDMETKFPLFYAIVKDQFITNCLNAQNHRDILKMHKSLLMIATRGSALLYELFELIRKNRIPWAKELEKPEVLELLDRCRGYLDPMFTDQTDPDKPRVLYLPDPTQKHPLEL